MLEFKKVTQNGYTNEEATFEAELVSVSDTAIQRNNERQTEFYPCSIKLPNGNVVSAAIEASNLERFGDRYNIGQKNTITARKVVIDGETNIYLTVAPFVGAKRASLEDLEEAFGKIKTVTKASAFAEPEKA